MNRVGVVKDLGVWLDSKMDFKYHVERTISRSNSLFGLIRLDVLVQNFKIHTSLSPFTVPKCC